MVTLALVSSQPNNLCTLNLLLINVIALGTASRSFGPIAPPASSQTSPSNNPYSSLKVEEQDEEEEEEDDTVTWRGRRK